MGLPLTRLPQGDSNDLDAKITVKKIQRAIFAFSPHKAPGLGGLSVDFYKSNVDLLATRMNLLLEYCHENDTLTDSMLEAYMILFA